MRKYFHSNHCFLYYESPVIVSMVMGLFLIVAAMITQGLIYAYNKFAAETATLNQTCRLLDYFYSFRNTLIIMSALFILLALLLKKFLPEQILIKRMIQRGLYYYPLGNPLRLKEGEILPPVRIRKIDNGRYEIKIRVTAFTVDDLSNVASNISSSINSKFFDRYAVIGTDSDISMNWVKFIIDDVTVIRKLTVDSVHQLKTGVSTKLKIQSDTNIDLSTSGSILVAGKTRSGKTTGIISLLLQALQYGRDDFGSEIIIIDPKRAELSRLPHTVTLTEDGEGTEIIAALQRFENAVVRRQKILNDLSEEKGDAVKWWDAGMHVSFLFIDEYVSARSIFPQKASKDNPDYSLNNFDGLVKRIVTMGASAGCYVIISIAEASVESGGLPAMIRSAMSTKILFKPTQTEARLIWDSEKLKNFPERIYQAGDAWFSSTDGINDNVTYVRFPQMDFKVYKELGELLRCYYDEK